MDTKDIQRTFIVAFDQAQGDSPVLCVGEKDPGRNIMNVIKVVKDQEAIDIFKKLIKEE